MTIIRTQHQLTHLARLAERQSDLTVAFTPESRKDIERLGKRTVLSEMQLISATPLRWDDGPDDLTLHGMSCESSTIVEDMAFINRFAYEVLGLSFNISCSQYPGFDTHPAAKILEDNQLAA